MMLAMLLAVIAAAVIALGTSLQHRAASSLRGRGPKAPGLMKHLLLRPGWRLGVILSGVGFCLHAAALRQGSISLVQPIVVSAIVFAVFVRAALDRQRPTREEVLWSAWTWAGLALLISLLPEAMTAGITAQPADDRMARIFFAGGIVITDIAILGAHQTSSRRCRGLLLGGASGVLFGLVAGLVKVLTSVAGGDVLTMARHWWLWAILVLGTVAMLLNQHAYATASLSLTMPVLNVVNILIATAFGLFVFHENPFGSPSQLISQVLALAAMGVGIWRLAALKERSAESSHGDMFRDARPHASAGRP